MKQWFVILITKWSVEIAQKTYYITQNIVKIDNMDCFLPACQTGLSGFVGFMQWHAEVVYC